MALAAGVTVKVGGCAVHAVACDLEKPRSLGNQRLHAVPKELPFAQGDGWNFPQKVVPLEAVFIVILF